MMVGQQEPSMIKEQLDLGEELERIDYLLRGYTLEFNSEEGVKEWIKPDNKIRHKSQGYILATFHCSPHDGDGLNDGALISFWVHITTTW